MERAKRQTGFTLIEGLLVVFLIAVIVAAGLYVKNRNKTAPASSSQPTTSSTDYKSLATDPSKQGTVTGIEAVLNSNSSDEAQVETQAENSQSQKATSDSSNASSAGDNVNEKAINF